LWLKIVVELKKIACKLMLIVLLSASISWITLVVLVGLTLITIIVTVIIAIIFVEATPYASTPSVELRTFLVL